MLEGHFHSLRNKKGKERGEERAIKAFYLLIMAKQQPEALGLLLFFLKF